MACLVCCSCASTDVSTLMWRCTHGFAIGDRNHTTDNIHPCTLILIQQYYTIHVSTASFISHIFHSCSTSLSKWNHEHDTHWSPWACIVRRVHTSPFSVEEALLVCRDRRQPSATVCVRKHTHTYVHTQTKPAVSSLSDYWDLFQRRQGCAGATWQ